MTIAYVFQDKHGKYFPLSTMILPQLEKNNHGVKVALNILCLQVGERF